MFGHFLPRISLFKEVIFFCSLSLVSRPLVFERLVFWVQDVPGRNFRING